MLIPLYTCQIYLINNISIFDMSKLNVYFSRMKLLRKFKWNNVMRVKLNSFEE